MEYSEYGVMLSRQSSLKKSNSQNVNRRLKGRDPQIYEISRPNHSTKTMRSLEINLDNKSGFGLIGRFPGSRRRNQKGKRLKICVRNFEKFN